MTEKNCKRIYFGIEKYTQNYSCLDSPSPTINLIGMGNNYLRNYPLTSRMHHDRIGYDES